MGRSRTLVCGNANLLTDYIRAAQYRASLSNIMQILEILTKIQKNLKEMINNEDLHTHKH